MAGGLEPAASAQWPWDEFVSQQRSPRSAARAARPTSSGDTAARSTVRRGGRAVAGAAARARPVPTGRASRAVKAEPKEEAEEVVQGVHIKQEAGAPPAAAAAAKPRRRGPVLSRARRAAPAAEQAAERQAAVKEEPVQVKQEEEQRPQRPKQQPQKQQQRVAAPAPAAAVAPVAAPAFEAPAPAAPAPVAAPPAVRACFLQISVRLQNCLPGATGRNHKPSS